MAHYEDYPQESPLIIKNAGPANESEIADHYFYELVEVIKAGNFQLLRELLQTEEYRNTVGHRDSKDGFSLLHVSADKKDQECIRILLEVAANPNIRDKLGRTPLHRVLAGGCRCQLCTNKRLGCIRNLTSHQANVNAEDLNGETPLYYAARHMMAEPASLLLEKGADLTYVLNDDSKTLSALVVQKLPGVMEKEFDKCIKYDKHDNSKLRIDFGVILQTPAKEKSRRKHDEVSFRSRTCCSKSPFPCETDLLFDMLKADGIGRVGLLTHPLTEAFLHLKWQAVRKHFFVQRSFFFLLTILYTVFAFDIFVWTCPHDWQNKFGSPNRFQSTPEQPCEINARVFICGVIFVVTITAMVLYELYKMCTDPILYFKTGLNYAWWILIFCIALTVVPSFDVELQQWQYPLSAFGVIYAWAMNLAQMGRMPTLGVYVELLAKVLYDFALFLLTYSSLLAGFALGFCILIPDHEIFYSIPLSFLKVLMIMTGDLDYFRIFNPLENERLVDPEYSVPAHLIYGAFIIVMTIVLMSLLLGLAVSDIQELQKKAKINRSIRLIREIYFLEMMSRNNFLFCGLSHYIERSLSIYKLPETKRGYVTFSPTDPDDHTFTDDIKMQFIPYLSTSSCAERKLHIRSALPQSRSLFSKSEIRNVDTIQEQPVEPTYNELLVAIQEIMKQNETMNQRLNSISNTLDRLM